MKTAMQLLVEARATLSYPDTITKFKPACDVLGNQVSPLSPAARRWCSTGAIIKASGGETGEQLEIAISTLQFAMGGNIPDFHDNHSREEILEKFDLAISLLRSMDPLDVGVENTPTYHPHQFSMESDISRYAS